MSEPRSTVIRGDETARTAEGTPVPTRRLATRCLRLSGTLACQVVRDAVAAGGEMWVKGSGQSMMPTIRNADRVLLSPVRGPVRRGDIVLVPLGPGLMLHRIVEIAGDEIITRGDARPANDLPIGKGQVLARAVAVRRGERVHALMLTLRFGVGPLLRFTLENTRRRARTVKRKLAYLRGLTNRR